MILDQQTTDRSYGIIYGVPVNFSRAPDGIQVSIHAFLMVFEPYEDSWGTMVTSNEFSSEGNLIADLESLSLNTYSVRWCVESESWRCAGVANIL